MLNGVGLQVRRGYGEPMLLSSNDSHPHPRQPTYYGPHSAIRLLLLSDGCLFDDGAIAGRSGR